MAHGSINIIVILGMVVVFTSVLFMFFTFDQFLADTMDCSSGRCKISQFSVPASAGAALIAAFLIIDTLVFWVIVKNII
ncbi:MAG: hypothetical protein JW716_03485 [Candidatus Aenigmarchaeota archaeon]|nr:hypothetical protein [Candidatus Aenigmarchaeota archaeon]